MKERAGSYNRALWKLIPKMWRQPAKTKEDLGKKPLGQGSNIGTDEAMWLKHSDRGKGRVRECCSQRNVEQINFSMISPLI